MTQGNETDMRMLDLFCGRLGWSKAFLAKGWKCVGVDLVEPPEIPQGFEFWKYDIMRVKSINGWLYIERVDAPNQWVSFSDFDFICASPPCQEFSKFGMPNFYPNPKYPGGGIRLFNHTREICEASGVPYVMENVRAATQFVGEAVRHCGPFYLWGTGVPPILPQGFKKGGRLGTGGWQHTGSKNKKENAAQVATIPPELSACVADYAERLLEQKQVVKPGGIHV